MRAPIILLALLGFCLSACYKEEDFDSDATAPDEVITRMFADDTVLLANNSDVANITAVLPEEGEEGIDVVFTTEQGVFTGNDTKTITVKSKVGEVDGERRVVAEAKVRSGLSKGKYKVTAAIGGYAGEVRMEAVDNPPSSMELSASTLALSNDPGSEVEITAQLRADAGTVTKGHVVDMEVLTVDDVPIGSFRISENESNADGRCRFVYSLLPDSTYDDTLRIKATTPGAGGAVEATLLIYAIN